MTAAALPAAEPSRVPLGIALMLGFCVLIPFADASAKLIGDRLPLAEIVLLRFAAQSLLLWPLVRLSGGTARMPRRTLAIVALRALLQSCGIGLMVLSLRYLPLADAVAIAFVMPFIMLALGWAFAGEEVGPHRLAACSVGFVGTLLVVQPNFVAVGAPALLPLAVALVFSLFMLATRMIARETEPLALQAMTGTVATLVLLPALLVTEVLGIGRGLEMPARGDLGILALMVVAGTAAHLLMTWSLRYAPSATLAPMQYVEIPFAAVVGWLIFGDFPNGLALVGIAVTIVAGLYVIHRERRAARAR